ncbi:DUF2834 domain-containing protein [Hahella ganghwensis]|uniref:DUF2834 domain-containing protein n=1 Tax=Hahella ganghwensis TaxID=286420 RepID=UPI00035FD325|nr:DUF2834 domain-containing protein [Hahella ganghwensis]
MKKAALPLIVLILFVGFTAVVMLQAEQSLIAFGLSLMSQPDTAQVVIDLYIMAGLACVWMFYDLKARNKPVIHIIPYALLTAIFVSVGPLLYLVVRCCSEQEKR